MNQDFLIVGLGNHGEKYAKTRHNVGFRVVELMAKIQQVEFQLKKDLKGEIARFQHNGKTVTLLKPITYMNLSGESVRKTLDYFKIGQEKLLVISDDVDLPMGQLRVRSSGSSGGHNGLKSIEAALGSKEYYRMKVGVGKDLQLELADYVLGRFSEEDEVTLKEVLPEAAKTALGFIEQGYQGAIDHLAKWRAKKLQ